MKKFNVVSFSYQLIIVAVALIDAFVVRLSTDFYFILHPLLWTIPAIIFFVLYRKQRSIKNSRQKFDYIIIFTIFNLITIYLLGFITTFQYSAYSHSAVAIIKNTCQFVVPIVCYEMLRQAFMSNATTKADFVMVTITMCCAYLDLRDFIHIFYNGLTFSYLFGTFASCVVTQVFLNWLIKHAGLKSTLVWQIAPIIVELLTPILPRMDWFYELLISIAWPLMCFVFFYYTYPGKNAIKEVKFQKKQKPYGYIFTFVAVFIVVGISTGMFGIKMTAIASNSMNPYFYRGDIVVVKTCDDYQIDDVIEYRHNNMMVVHRIVEEKVDSSGEVYFITKGDNNNANDTWVVTKSQIKGKVQFVIPKIGYLTLWISELF